MTSLAWFLLTLAFLFALFILTVSFTVGMDAASAFVGIVLVGATVSLFKICYGKTL